MRFAVGAAVLAGAIGLGGLLAGCERGASAPARTHEAASSRDDGGGSGGIGSDRGGASYESSGGGSSYASRGGGGGGDSYEPRRAREPVPDFKGEPMWADNRRHTAQENAKYHCDKSGEDIGAKSLDECLTKVHAFIDHPPTGAQTMTRPNGDRLIYDPKGNLFAVARKDGAPRTFFKPRDGADYWKQQQDEAKNGGSRRRYAGGGDTRDGDAG